MVASGPCGAWKALVAAGAWEWKTAVWSHVLQESPKEGEVSTPGNHCAGVRHFHNIATLYAGGTMARETPSIF